ncbi:MAG: oligoendopeptidase F [Planctomycetes bacterium]|nr:oligoendopeptidase F [Planctomycetota bacterium]
MNAPRKLPVRSEVPAGDMWDLSSLFPTDQGWQEEFKKWEGRIGEYESFRGKLGESAASLAACLTFDNDFERQAERLGVYAFLRSAEDQANADTQAMVARFQNVATRAGEAASYIRPEILAIPDDRMAGFLSATELAPFRLVLERLVRYKPHTLSPREEQLLAMQGEMAGAASNAFRKLLDADMKFGTVTNEKGEEVELTNASFLELLQSPDREVRKTAFHQYYEQFLGHENTLAATLQGSIHKDVYYARARSYDGALAMSLFPDNVPQAVYDNLIAAVRKQLPTLHRYYDVRRRKMKLDDIHHYDTYVPILSDLEIDRPWDEAVELVAAAVAPLGEDYVSVLRQGLSGRWCDRYPNRGKQSGAFSSGSYDGDPYILMNYKSTVFNDVFTLAHEAGHSMHSYYSARHQPFQYYDYTIFVAEVASTFNEQLLSRHLRERAADDRERAYLVNREIDDIRGTVFRQTMFAEFEKITHAMAEQGEPLTVKTLQDAYSELLAAYFGPEFVIDDELRRECFRIPHFYRAFYVYKYATGMSAAIALSRRVLEGGEQELQDYLGFLQGGCSKDPLDLLRGAGVDMEQPEPVETALTHFASLVDELDELL